MTSASVLISASKHTIQKKIQMSVNEVVYIYIVYSKNISKYSELRTQVSVIVWQYIMYSIIVIIFLIFYLLKHNNL